MSPRVIKDAINGGNGLACPYYRMDPEKYKHHKRCHPYPGKVAWKVGKVVEHLWRCHAPQYACPYCHVRYPSLTRGNAEKKLRDHIQNCGHRKALGGAPRTRGADEPDIMTEAQQDAFKAAKQRRDPETKLGIIYSALGFGERLPDTYHVFPTTVGIQETSTLFPIPEQQQHDDHYEGGTLEPHSEEPPTAPTQVLPPQTPTPSPPLLEPGIDGSDSLPPDLLKLYNIPSPRPISDIDNNSGIACQYDSCGDNYQNCELGDNGRNSSFFGGLTQPDCSEAGDMPAAPSRASTMSQIAALAEPDINDVPSLTNPSTLDDKTTVITPVNTNNAEGKGKGNEELPQSKLDNIYLPVVLHASDDALSLRDGNAADLLKGTAEPQEDMQWPLELNDEEDELYEFREGGGWDFSM